MTADWQDAPDDAPEAADDGGAAQTPTVLPPVPEKSASAARAVRASAANSAQAKPAVPSKTRKPTAQRPPVISQAPDSADDVASVDSDAEEVPQTKAPVAPKPRAPRRPPVKRTPPRPKAAKAPVAAELPLDPEPAEVEVQVTEQEIADVLEQEVDVVEQEASVAEVIEQEADVAEQENVAVAEVEAHEANEPDEAGSGADTEPAVRIRGLVKSFGHSRAVDGIDLTVPAGSFYGLVGPNGAGKTTTLSMISGLLRPDRGSISIAGIDAIAKPRQAKRMLGILPDRLRTFDRLTGLQLLHYYGLLRGLSRTVVTERAADLVRAFDLTDAIARPVSDYSAGMTKKLMLAGAMIHSPRVLVLDEPFEAVDPASSDVILKILATYVSNGGTVILSSHGMGLIERVCSRVGVIVAGQVLAEGTIDEVRGELTLEQRFIELSGGLSDVEGLEWLHTFSG